MAHTALRTYIGDSANRCAIPIARPIGLPMPKPSSDQVALVPLIYNHIFVNSKITKHEQIVTSKKVGVIPTLLSCNGLTFGTKIVKIVLWKYCLFFPSLRGNQRKDGLKA